MPPKSVDWAAEAGHTARAMAAGQVRPVASRVSGDGVDGYALVRAQRRRLRGFWNCHGKAFAEWWMVQPSDDKAGCRRHALHCTAPPPAPLPACCGPPLLHLAPGSRHLILFCHK